jgi:sulfatase maturation enzyme AslB (radical SAM superfamily)
MNKFCADIHNNLALTLTNSGITVGACCWYNDARTVSLGTDYWNMPNLLDLRELNKKDQLDLIGCRQCIYMEQHGSSSRRTGVNEYYKSTTTDLSGPRGLEIKIDYTCNIACVYCGPHNSTKWRLEEKTDKNRFPIRLDKPDIISLLDTFDLSNLDNIHFYGGDPLLTDTHEIILNYIDSRCGLQNLYVWYNTNGTIKVSQRVLDLWAKCRIIKVYFSIDDIGARFEYIRYGAVWNEVEDNMQWFNQNCPVNTMFTIQPTMSCLNALHHNELLSWKEKYFNTNRLGDFVDITRHNVFRSLELDSMPDELMLQCLENNKNDSWYNSFVKSFKYNSLKHTHAKDKIAVLNSNRNLDFAKIFPDLVPYYL